MIKVLGNKAWFSLTAGLMLSLIQTVAMAEDFNPKDDSLYQLESIQGNDDQNLTIGYRYSAKDQRSKVLKNLRYLDQILSGKGDTIDQQVMNTLSHQFWSYLTLGASSSSLEDRCQLTSRAREIEVRIHTVSKMASASIIAPLDPVPSFLQIPASDSPLMEWIGEQCFDSDRPPNPVNKGQIEQRIRLNIKGSLETQIKAAASKTATTLSESNKEIDNLKKDNPIDGTIDVMEAIFGSSDQDPHLKCTADDPKKTSGLKEIVKSSSINFRAMKQDKLGLDSNGKSLKKGETSTEIDKISEFRTIWDEAQCSWVPESNKLTCQGASPENLRKLENFLSTVGTPSEAGIIHRLTELMDQLGGCPKAIEALTTWLTTTDSSGETFRNSFKTSVEGCLSSNPKSGPTEAELNEISALTSDVQEYLDVIKQIFSN